ncbi:MAG: tetratricopeptide repeat protein [Spirochaetota bacterium]
MRGLFRLPSGIILNLLFCVYALLYSAFLRPFVFPAAHTAVTAAEKSPNPVFGVLVLLAFIFETIGMRIHMLWIRERFAGRAPKSYSGPVLVMIGHLVVSFLLGIAAMTSFFGSASPPIVVVIIVVLLVLAREGYIAVLIYNVDTPPATTVSFPLRLVAHLMLFSFVCIAYTVAWEAFTLSDIDQTFNVLEPITIVAYLGMLLVGAMVLIPIRLGYYMEERLSAGTTREKILLAISVLVMISLASSPMFRIYSAEDYARRGRKIVSYYPVKALNDFSKAIALAPTNPVYYADRALAYRGLRDNENARSNFNAAIALDDSRAMSYVGRGDLFFSEGNTANAKRDYYRAMELAPSNYLVHFAVGRFHAEEREYAAALSALSRAVALRKNHTAALEYRGYVYEATRNDTAAIADYRIAASNHSRYARERLRKRYTIELPKKDDDDND